MAVYIHPYYSNEKTMQDMGSVYAGPALGFGQDVMRTTLRLIMNGIFDRIPNLKIIIGHLGEYYPFVLNRIDNRSKYIPDPMVKNKNPVSYYFKNKNIFMTTSGNLSKEAFLCTKNVIGIENILFATDYPYESMKETVSFIDSLELSKEDLEKICFKNAEKYIFK